MKTYLALGDSYTIGEQVLEADNFPNKTVAILNTPKILFSKPKIIATTGWTTDELNHAIDAENILNTFDFVTLLIGVNNQYRGRSVENFAIEFEQLLKRSIKFANNNHEHVIVLSIPDWGITPFAADRDAQQIAKEIDAYNLVCRNIAQKYKTYFLDITTAQRMDGNKEDFLAKDTLHPSAKEYAKWAKQVAQTILQQLAHE